ncbi:MAG: hypothetical protein VXW22_10220 [Pseudomonadota bacterium]|nr:hypothetical protein [Pseudomonadota bacterium]
MAIKSREDFYTLESAEGLTDKDWRFIQSTLLEMSDEELGEALGYNDTERGRKYVQRQRTGKSGVAPAAVTAMWLLVFNEETDEVELPVWMGI